MRENLMTISAQLLRDFAVKESKEEGLFTFFSFS